jgi:serine/threonine protein kinase
VCHRDISLENILIDKQDRLVLIDHGMSLRVPYTDPSNYGCVTDVSAGTRRRLTKSQGQGGKHMYAAPEVINKSEVVDAFAIDLWSAGVVLFVMLVGLAPFEGAHATDKRYAKISRGGLKELMDALEIPLSPEACDILQGFFWNNPRRRFTLAEAIEHPWVQGKQFVDISPRPPKPSRKSTFAGRLEKAKNSTEWTKKVRNPHRARCRPELGRPRLVTPHVSNYSQIT